MHEVRPPTRNPVRVPDPAWPWDQPPNAAAITCRAVLAGAPILHVSHDSDDHGWQFLDGGDYGDDAATSEGRLIGMGHVLELDPGLRELADLPPGWIAWRDTASEPWRREPHS
jgi:hypothetical protein